MKFLTRTILLVLFLYGLIFAFGDYFIARYDLSIWYAVAFPVLLIGFQYLVGPFLIRAILDIAWDDSGTLLPAVNREFVLNLCKARGIPVPRIGIIYSGTPNAFSFGRVRSDANVVVSQGLLDVLTPEETNAVLAHEIGHIEHYDFAVMTIAALVPLVLYQIYVFADRINQARVIAWGAYICYILSQYMVLFLNRTREYFADHYAAQVTRKPDLLSSALVKIAYGMVRVEGEYRQAMAEGSAEDKKTWRRERRLAGAFGVMGISHLNSGSSLALSGANPAEAAAVMRWDLVNPWARMYELSSTHPLTALRVRALNQQATDMHQVPQYQLPNHERKHWGQFPVEFFVWASPWIASIAFFFILFEPRLMRELGIHVPPNTPPILLISAGVLWFLRILYRYRGQFQNAAIGNLLESVEVSEMRPQAVRLKGKILGRGVPGAFWSADLVIKDASGIIFLLNRQSIPFARYFFALTGAESYIDQEVEVEGWFRRGLTPYVEMSKLTGSRQESYRSYSRWIQVAIAAIVVAIGWLWKSGSL